MAKIYEFDSSLINYEDVSQNSFVVLADNEAHELVMATAWAKQNNKEIHIEKHGKQIAFYFTDGKGGMEKRLRNALISLFNRTHDAMSFAFICGRSNMQKYPRHKIQDQIDCLMDDGFIICMEGIDKRNGAPLKKYFRLS